MDSSTAPFLIESDETEEESWDTAVGYPAPGGLPSPPPGEAEGPFGMTARSPQHQRACDILIVEDDAAIRESLLELLEDEGYSVRTARHGQEALQLLRDGSAPALILLDLMMPVMNGWEFRAEQRRDTDLAGIPVVAVSGAGNLDQKAVALGLTEYLRKPVDIDVLLSTIERFCG